MEFDGKEFGRAMAGVLTEDRELVERLAGV